MTDKNCAALAYGLNLLRLLRSMALISEVEYQRIFRLQVEHYDPQKKVMSGSLILAILAGCMQTHVVSFVLPQRKAAITKRSDRRKEISMRKTVTELAMPEQGQRLIRLAPYTRVSSGSDDQLHSFAAQVKYYTEYAAAHPEYELVDIYADEAVTGTRMDKRDDLNRLLRDCRKGKIDRIITKSVSRFARNTTELLTMVRGLKELGVSIYFEEQGIDTAAIDLEMILTFPGHGSAKGVGNHLREYALELIKREWNPEISTAARPPMV